MRSAARPVRVSRAGARSGLPTTARVAWRIIASCSGLSGHGARLWLRWAGRHFRWVFWCLLLAAFVGFPLGQARPALLLAAAGVVPGVVAVAWKGAHAASFERLCAGPARRFGWRWWARRKWPTLARECGLSVQRKRRRWAWALTPKEKGRLIVSQTSEVAEWVHPLLMDVLTRGNTLTLLVRARVGQTVDDLEKAAAALGAAASAVSYRTRALTPSVLEIALVMREALSNTVTASIEKLPSPGWAVTVPAESLVVDSVRMGRRQDGSEWWLPLIGRHTLVAGCSGSGKGSMLWGVCGGLGPAVSADVVRLWGIDLKRGVEIGMGRDLFTDVATRPVEAVAALQRLMAVIDRRGQAMIGVSRLHTPRPGDPLHVLVIDELAALTAYSDPDIRRDASRLLSEVLTQGRALGVVVLACVQDPRKEVVGMRGLFTQTIALRLRSAEETRMVLGDGMADLAPAHRISPAAPGTGWVVEEDGSTDRVRADFWPDDLVRYVANTCPAPIQTTGLTTTAPPAQGGQPAVAGTREAFQLRLVDLDERPSPARKPRKPRSPRTTRQRVPRQSSDPA